jgi:7 transmembrane receptor (rhodopsin family)
MTSNYSGTGNETATTEPTPSCYDELAADSYNYTDYTQLDPVRHVFTALYFIVIILSLCGNAMVILTVSRNRHMRTVTNCYLVNLATSDFLVASCVMPLKLLEYTAPACEWTLWRSDWLCSLLYFALPVFVFTSVLTLIAISIER